MRRAGRLLTHRRRRRRRCVCASRRFEEREDFNQYWYGRHPSLPLERVSTRGARPVPGVTAARAGDGGALWRSPGRRRRRLTRASARRYSKYTIDKIVEEVEAAAESVAFLSTPSIYYSLKSKALKASSCVFDVRADDAHLASAWRRR